MMELFVHMTHHLARIHADVPRKVKGHWIGRFLKRSVDNERKHNMKEKKTLQMKQIFYSLIWFIIGGMAVYTSLVEKMYQSGVTMMIALFGAALLMMSLSMMKDLCKEVSNEKSIHAE